MRPLLGGDDALPPAAGARHRRCCSASPEAEIRRLLKLLGRMGKVDEVAHDHFFLRDTVAEIVEIMRRHRSARRTKDEFTAAQFRDRLDNGRKVAIQILEFFDRHGVTMRRGDLRRINRHRLDLFRPSPAAKRIEESSSSGRRIVPGGASGLQIREGPRAGPWWVRLPLSSATFQERGMTATAAAYLDRLKSATVSSESAEAELRREFSARLKAIEHDRAFAFRRYNLMRAVAEGVAAAESEEIAVANALAILRTRLGWHSDSEPRTAILSQFAPVAKAMFLSAAPPEAEAAGCGRAVDAERIRNLVCRKARHAILDPVRKPHAGDAALSTSDAFRERFRRVADARNSQRPANSLRSSYWSISPRPG